MACPFLCGREKFVRNFLREIFCVYMERNSQNGKHTKKGGIRL
jgi:hypothetical protein